MTRYLLGALVIVLSVQLVALVNLYLRIRGMVLRRPRWRIAAPEEPPTWLVDFAAPAATRLLELGFAPRGALASVGFDRQLDDEGFDLLFEHAEAGTWAFVYVLPTVPAGRPLHVDFVTWFEDGDALMTLAARPGVADRAVTRTTLVPLPHLSLGRRFVQHRYAVEARSVASAAMNPERIVADLTARHAGLVDAALAAGEVVPTGEATFAHTPGGAWRVLRGVLRGLLGGDGDDLRAYFGSFGPDRIGDPPPAPHAARIHAELLALARGKARRGARVWVFLGTLALFAISLTAHVSAGLLAMLVGVLLLHELGHFAAMRLFGYRETSVYFLPFLGAAASGTKPEATLSERALVFLAGPVPGLAAGLALAHGGPPDALWVLPLTLMLVYINLFNLLPVLPLDGGRLVERVLLPHHPRGEAVFKAVSAAAFGGVAWVTGESLLWVVSAFVGLSLPHTLRVARAWARLGPDLPADAEGLYARLMTAGLAERRFPRFFRLVSDLAVRQQAPRASVAARAAWCGVYVSLLVGALWLARDLLPGADG